MPIRLLPLLCALFCSLTAVTLPAAEFPKFIAQEIDPHAGNVCYAVTLADVDGDQKNDIVVVTENRVVWYRNPDWKLHVIIADQTDRDNVCIAAHDIDGDGKIDFALGAGWTKIGTVQWLSRGDTLDEKWNVHFIGKERWLHRMRWGDFLGTGKPQLVISPLNKTVADGVRLTAFEVPANPKTDRWNPTVLDETLNAMHNHWMGDFDGDGRTDIVTASREGVFLFQHDAQRKLIKKQLATGARDDKTPTGNGAGEIKVGRLSKTVPFIATVEPMHGNSIAIYTPPAPGSKMWTRHVLDESLKRGHALAIADVDQDGVDELVVGHSDPGTGQPVGPGVFLYDCPAGDGQKWVKHTVDNGGVATEDLVAGDLDGDGWIDIVAVGRGTHNVKLYRNAGRPK